MAEVGLDSVFGNLSLDSIRSSAYGIAEYVIWGVILLALGIFGWTKWQDKKIYIYPTRIFRQRANGQVKELNQMGGYVKKGNITNYVIKMGRFKKKIMNKLPLSEYMDEDNRVYYWQVSPDAPLIQVKKDFVIDKILVPNDKFTEPTKEESESLFKKYLEAIDKEEEYKNLSKEEKNALASDFVKEEIEARKSELIDITKPTYSPVPTDLKQQAMAEINNYKLTLGVDTNKQMIYFVTGVIALVILGIVIFYIAVNKGDLPILTK